MRLKGANWLDPDGKSIRWLAADAFEYIKGQPRAADAVAPVRAADVWAQAAAGPKLDKLAAAAGVDRHAYFARFLRHACMQQSMRKPDGGWKNHGARWLPRRTSRASRAPESSLTRVSRAGLHHGGVGSAKGRTRKFDLGLALPYAVGSDDEARARHASPPPACPTQTAPSLRRRARYSASRSSRRR